MSWFSLPWLHTDKPVAKPKLGPLLPVIDAILEANRIGPLFCGGGEATVVASNSSYMELHLRVGGHTWTSKALQLS